MNSGLLSSVEVRLLRLAHIDHHRKANLSFKSFDVYDTFKGLPKSKYQPELDDLEGLFHSLDNFMKASSLPSSHSGLVPALPEDDAQYDFVHVISTFMRERWRT